LPRRFSNNRRITHFFHSYIVQNFCLINSKSLQDGRNYTSPSRFPCYYTPNHGEFVAANLDLEVMQTYSLLSLVSFRY
jgi:hypothetical protein